MNVNGAIKPRTTPGPAPRYTADSPWARSIANTIRNVEDRINSSKVVYKTPSPTFSIVRGPDNELGVFTLPPAPKGAGKAVNSPLIRICSIEKDQINTEFLSENVAPIVKAIHGKKPPYISEAELVNEKTELKNVGIKAAIPLVVSGLSVAVCYGAYVWGSGGESGSMALRASETLAMGKPIGQATLGIACLSSSIRLLSHYFTSPTRETAKMDSEGEGVFSLSGPSTERRSGLPTKAEFTSMQAAFRKDLSASMPGGI